MRTRDMGWSCRHSSRFMKCLNVIVCHACALNRGVTYVGNYLYWALLTCRGITISSTGSVHEDNAR